LTATALYNKLLSQNVLNAQGAITASLNGINVNVSDVSVVGNILQEWLEHFMIKHSIFFRKPGNPQDFPDFFLSTSSTISDLLEVKSFHKSPNFDIANFSAYARSLRNNAYRLDADYLIFEYKPKGINFIISNIWLKKVWEICGPSARSDVKIQWKQGTAVNIRPVTWYSSKAEYKPFASRLDFLKSLNKVIGQAGIDASIQNNWLSAVKQNYQSTTGNPP
jgi:type II restriction enzyme